MSEEAVVGDGDDCDPRVHADEPGRLWPGERPFTDWGQFGYASLDLRVLDQATYWVDVAGAPHRLSEMSPDYRVNVLAFLRDGVDYYHLMTIRRLLIELYADLAAGCTDPPALRRLPALLEAEPTAWLDATPLVQALTSASPGHYC